MKCIVCNIEFSSKRKDAKFCSSTCRSNKFRKYFLLKSATDNATDKSATDKVSVTKDSWLCKIDGCNLINMHGGMCIYHWRKSESLVTIPEKEYNLLNTGNPC